MELHEVRGGTSPGQVGKLGNEMASMAKYWVTDLENKVTRNHTAPPKVAADCLQLHGGWGFMWETNIAKAYASARVQVRGSTHHTILHYCPDHLRRNQ